MIKPNKTTILCGFERKLIMREFKELILLGAVAEVRGHAIYDIHFCDAGIGIIYYDYDNGGEPNENEGWKEHLFVENYYPTLREALIEEVKRLLDKVEEPERTTATDLAKSFMHERPAPTTEPPTMRPPIEKTE